jgi:hypothetical protein
MRYQTGDRLAQLAEQLHLELEALLVTLPSARDVRDD